MIDVGVVVFPGSTCERDLLAVLAEQPGVRAIALEHRAARLPALDAVGLPGGFSYGDYLRPGAIARFAPVMEPVQRFARAGGPLFGICNGFQILTELGLLPGALLPNRDGRFICRPVTVRVEGRPTPLTCGLAAGRVLQLPVAHHAGRYCLPEPELARLADAGQVVLRYCDPQGRAGEQDGGSDDSNPNGSAGSVAAVCNAAGNVVGLMPHPERATHADRAGGTDGQALFDALLRWCRGAPLSGHE